MQKQLAFCDGLSIRFLIPFDWNFIFIIHLGQINLLKAFDAGWVFVFQDILCGGCRLANVVVDVRKEDNVVPVVTSDICCTITLFLEIWPRRLYDLRLRWATLSCFNPQWPTALKYEGSIFIHSFRRVFCLLFAESLVIQLMIFCYICGVCSLHSFLNGVGIESISTVGGIWAVEIIYEVDFLVGVRHEEIALFMLPAKFTHTVIKLSSAIPSLEPPCSRIKRFFLFSWAQPLFKAWRIVFLFSWRQWWVLFHFTKY